jgi:hypothetical protein
MARGAGAVSISEPRPTRRSRREIEAIKEALYLALLEDQPMTMRQPYPYHPRFSTGQFHASENARLNESRKLKRWLWK